jgi:hypothetical protein
MHFALYKPRSKICNQYLFPGLILSFFALFVPSSLFHLPYSKIGELEVLKVWSDIQLVEYRTVFNTLKARNLMVQGGTLQNSREFEASLKLFTSCQGKLVSCSVLVFYLAYTVVNCFIGDSLRTSS